MVQPLAQESILTLLELFELWKPSAVSKSYPILAILALDVHFHRAALLVRRLKKTNFQDAAALNLFEINAYLYVCV